MVAKSIRMAVNALYKQIGVNKHEQKYRILKRKNYSFGG